MWGRIKLRRAIKKTNDDKTMKINLSEDAVHALNRSAAAAAREGAEAVEPQHILAGVLSEGGSDLVSACERLGLDLAELPDSMTDLPRTYEGHLPFALLSHKLLEAAIDFASDRGSTETTTAHLLLGVLRAGNARTAAVLEAWGLKEMALAEELKRKAGEQYEQQEDGTKTEVNT